jgi:hypothetical protein
MVEMTSFPINQKLRHTQFFIASFWEYNSTIQLVLLDVLS